MPLSSSQISMTHPQIKTQRLSNLCSQRLIAIIRAKSAVEALWMGETLVQGGVSWIEITWNTPEAPRVLSSLKQQYPNVCWGAGTVLNTAMAIEALEAGAQYLISPATYPDILRDIPRTNSDILLIPGVTTPTEMVQAMALGADIVKIFPITPLGGPQYLSALRGPFPNTPTIVTGDVQKTDIPAYFKLGVDAIGLGSALLGGSSVIQDQNKELALESLQDFLSVVQRANHEFPHPHTPR